MLTLTNQELSDLTGVTQPAAQIRWLRNHRWIFEIGADWLPKVARAYFERRLVFGESVLAGAANEIKTTEWQVNTEALRPNPKS